MPLVIITERRIKCVIQLRTYIQCVCAYVCIKTHGSESRGQEEVPCEGLLVCITPINTLICNLCVVGVCTYVCTYLLVAV